MSRLATTVLRPACRQQPVALLQPGSLKERSKQTPLLVLELLETASFSGELFGFASQDPEAAWRTRGVAEASPAAEPALWVGLQSDCDVLLLRVGYCLLTTTVHYWKMAGSAALCVNPCWSKKRYGVYFAGDNINADVLVCSRAVPSGNYSKLPCLT